MSDARRTCIGSLKRICSLDAYNVQITLLHPGPNHVPFRVVSRKPFYGNSCQRALHRCHSTRQKLDGNFTLTADTNHSYAGNLLQKNIVAYEKSHAFILLVACWSGGFHIVRETVGDYKRFKILFSFPRLNGNGST